MERGVCYFLTGTSHALLLTVSAWSLRKYYAGPVAILTNEPTGVSAAIASDGRLSLTIAPMKIERLRRNSALIAKTTINQFSPFDTGVFLDADTIPVGDPSELFPSESDEMVWAQFSNWHLTGSPYEARVKRFALAAGKVRWFEQACKANWPAVNNGVFGFTKSASIWRPWHELARSASSVFIPDEAALSLIYHKYPHRLTDDRWNCSPVHGVNRDKVVVWHCHGSKVLKPRVKALWLGLLREVWEGNVGNVQELASTNDINTYLKAALVT